MATNSCFEIVYKVAMVLIALTNSAFAIHFLFKNYGTSKSDKEKDRRIQWIKTLILDHSLKNYYSFFEEANRVTTKFISETPLSDGEKAAILNEFTEVCGNLRKNFLDLFLAINENLYEKLLTMVDDLQAKITSSALDQGINLNHKPKCDEMILTKIRVLKTEMLKVIFSYNGDLEVK